MKELSIEEKAKAYDRVREKIALRFGTDVAEGIFSEFEESEDERVRKALLEMVHDTTGDELWVDYNVHKENALAWLEKQGKSYTKRDVDNAYIEGMAFAKHELEKQGEQKPQRMISAEAKEAMYNKPADTVEQKCEESKTKVFDAPTPFEDKLYAFVAACEFLTLPAKIEFIKEHSQELLDAAKEQIGKEQSSTWSKEDEKILNGLISSLVRIEANTRTDSTSINYTFPREIDWLKSLKQKIGE